ncbi:MAG TPA: cytochrome c [Gemmataceae bacterium]|nr:cytochrome c [Gemmataceae bacterium]
MGWRRLDVVRGPALLALMSFVAGCGGCGRDTEAYPATIVFPARKDGIVLRLPTNVPTQPEPNGELDEGIGRINERGGKVLNPAEVAPEQRQQLDEFLRQTFGTPGAPSVAGDDQTRALAKSLGLSDQNLAAGSKLFRARCQECHGVAGDGRGPTAPWLTPHPRDYRQGAFKFTSTHGPKPTRNDLFRTITNGLPTTAMPSFGMRTEEERQRLIDYVIFLSVRGRTELEGLRFLLLDGDETAEAAEAVKAELRAWAKAEADVIPATPPEVPDGSPEQGESIRRGHALFVDAKGAGCATCHTNYGREGKLQYDVWGTLLKPANLTEVKRKGGDAPEHLYCRVRAGIGPSNMPAASTLTDPQVWDVVSFLRALPYPDRLPEDVRSRVYPEGR